MELSVDLRYPIGKFSPPPDYGQSDLETDIRRIASLPERLKSEVNGFTESMFDTPYRPEGWTVRQLIHHLADSHLHAWIRIKWALTEENPAIKAYDEKRYAETPDNSLDPQLTLSLLEWHHKRWAGLLTKLTPEQLNRTFVHPATGNAVPVSRMVQLYAWHGDHHLAHISALRKRMNW